MVALTGARAEARQTERFKAGMYRTEASGHCLGSLNRIPPKTCSLYRSAAWIRQAGQMRRCYA
ncbi:hypothetical protein FHL81_06890 [Agrobacterium tumefaciens]|nr:hypothetical protein FHL81_06890 [Agrobacterium tumefaciens]KAB0458418.1 hypothetical protein F7R04_16685 [Agrobacterium tumefaciens]MQB36157.1 hypothetical protein [Agrobacterium tumefaciens]OVE92660.1 hypothetical protein B7W89_05005 [Agrobacterium tumefaciens]TGE82858.1 hypothetical protein C9410_04510 [Rhizobium sp. SEMIA 439]